MSSALIPVIGAARSLSDTLWMRETEGGGFDTPERRAALDHTACRTRVARDVPVARGPRQRQLALPHVIERHVIDSM